MDKMLRLHDTFQKLMHEVQKGNEQYKQLVQDQESF